MRWRSSTRNCAGACVAENGHATAPRGSWGEGVAAEPKQELKARPKINLDQVREFTRGVPEIDGNWLYKRSALDAATMTPGQFLDALYQPQNHLLTLPISGRRGISFGRPEQTIRAQKMRPKGASKATFVAAIGWRRSGG